MNFKKIISQGESEVVEFKQSIGEWKEIAETICAFANTVGGRIFIGVSNSGKMLGTEVGKDTIEALANKISLVLDPKIHPRITIERNDGKSIIVIEIKESSDHLILAFGRPYKRVGRSTLRMSKDEYERSILEKHKDKLQFDKQLCRGTSLKEIDWKFVKEEFIPLYEKVSERKTIGTVQSLLESLGCVRDQKPTNAGILLFAKNPQKLFMSAYIALARYRGKGIGGERLDYKEISGNLFQQIDKCDEYIRGHMAMMSRLLPYRVEREDIPEYPLFSVRELITNAVVHRDYSVEGSKAIIKMFDNRIEFYNPGGLSKGVTPQNIIRKQFSRNPVLTKVLSKVRYIEEIGEGWDKIIKEHKEHSLKPRLPKIEADEYSVTVELFSTKEKFAEEKKEKNTAELNQRQIKALEYVKEKSRITNKEYQQIAHTSRITATRDLMALAKNKLLKQKGVGRGSYFVLPL